MSAEERARIDESAIKRDEAKWKWAEMAA